MMADAVKRGRETEFWIMGFLNLLNVLRGSL
jgi:hypothetical protein